MGDMWQIAPCERHTGDTCVRLNRADGSLVTAHIDRPDAERIIHALETVQRVQRTIVAERAKILYIEATGGGFWDIMPESLRAPWIAQAEVVEARRP